jgi:hypothetical protein
MITVVGAGRNGSTLIARDLNRFDKIYIHPVEERFVSKWSDLVRYGYERRKTKLNYRDDNSVYKDINKKLSKNILFNAYKESILLHAEIIHKNCDNALQFYNINLDKDFYFLQDFIETYIRISAKYENTKVDIIKEYGFKTIETPYLSYYAKSKYKIVHVTRNTLDVLDSQKRTLKLKNKSFSYLGSDWLSTMLFKRIIHHNIESCRLNEVIINYEEYVENQEILQINIQNVFGLEGLKKSKEIQSRDEYFNLTNSSNGKKLSNQVIKRTERDIKDTCLTQGEINYINYILQNNLNFINVLKLFLKSIDHSDTETLIQKFQLFLTRGYRTFKRYLI